jgi:DNA repair protein NreA
VRENVRNAMRQKPYEFKTLNDSLRFISGRFEIPMHQWIIQGKLLRHALFQSSLTAWL